MTLRYKDGPTIAQVGDFVKGPVYNYPGTIVGQIVKLAPNAPTHNCDVAFVEVIPDIASYIATIFSGSIPSIVIGTGTQTPDATGKKHGAVARIEQADTQALQKV